MFLKINNIKDIFYRMQNKLKRPVLFQSSHKADSFDCGVLELNNYLKLYALQNSQNGSARTYVANRDETVVGFYSLAYGSVSHDEVTPRLSKGLAKHPIPIILLARLAVDINEQGQGVGKSLLKDALLRSIEAADIAGLRAILVHSKDNSAKLFYEKFGFEASPIDPFHLFLLMKDVRKNLH